MRGPWPPFPRSGGRPPPGAGQPALIVLGCRVDKGELSPAAARRVDAAAAAWHLGGAALVLASGGRRWGSSVEAVEMGRALQARGVPRARITLELSSLSTIENARYSSEILRCAGIDRAWIVTCEWHAPRALRDFEAFGLHVSAVVAASPPLAVWAHLQRTAREACSEALDAHVRSRFPGPPGPLEVA